MSNYTDELINNYNCPDCNDAKLQSDKNARKINEVIDQVNALIQVNNETVDFIEEKANEVVEEVAEIKVNEKIEEITTEIDNIFSNVYDSKYKYSHNELMGGANIEVYDINSYYVTKLQCTLDNSLLTLNMQQGIKPNYNISVDGKSLKDPFVYKENGIYYMYVTYFFVFAAMYWSICSTPFKVAIPLKKFTIV